MTAYQKYRLYILGGALIAALVAFIIAHVVETHLSYQRIQGQMRRSELDFRSDVLGCMDRVMTYVAICIRDRTGSVANATQELVQQYKNEFQVDEINFADTNGVIQATTHVEQLHYYMGTDPDPSKAAGFLRLLEDITWYTQPPRITVQADNAYRKFVGIPMQGGFLQIGFNFQRLSGDLAKLLTDISVDWHVGETGYFILADDQTGEIYSDGRLNSPYSIRRRMTRSTLWHSGFRKEMMHYPPSYVFEAKIHGLPSVCSTFVIKESGHRVCMVIPKNEVMHSMKVSVGSTMLILLSLIGIVAAVSFRLVTLRERSEEIRQAEEERRTKDLNLATSIQAAALPNRFPPFPQIADCVDLFALMNPAKEVGGDFYDFYFISKTRVAFLVADVSGKGIPGAMFMMRAKTTLNDLLASSGDNLSRAIASVNKRLAEGNDANMFVTAWVGILDLDTGRLEYVNCGHNPPILRHLDGTNEWMRTVSGLPLGVFGQTTYQHQLLQLPPGDRLFLYTDGVTEAESHAGFYGEDRLLSVIARSSGSSRDVCNAVSADVMAFAQDVPQADDITMLDFQFHGVRRTFPCNSEGMCAAEEFLYDLDGDPRLSIVVDEILSNIVRCSGSPAFEVTLLREGSLKTLAIADHGHAFNPLSLPDPDINAPLEERKVGGLGIYMVKQLAEQVYYRRDGERNILMVLLKV